jgi:hypothetical protein
MARAAAVRSGPATTRPAPSGRAGSTFERDPAPRRASPRWPISSRERRLACQTLRSTRIAAQVGRFGLADPRLQDSVVAELRRPGGGIICLFVVSQEHAEPKFKRDVPERLSSKRPGVCRVLDTANPPPHQRRRLVNDTLTDQTPLFPTKHVQPRRPHGRHDSMGECIENWIDLFACRRCSTSSPRYLICQRRGPERRRFDLFHRKRKPDREWRAAQSGGNDRGPSIVPLRIQGSSHQSPQRSLRGGHGQRSRAVRSRAHHRCDAGGGASSRFFRAHAGYGRARIGKFRENP